VGPDWTPIDNPAFDWNFLTTARVDVRFDAIVQLLLVT